MKKVDARVKKVLELQEEYNSLLKRIDEILCEQSKLMRQYYGRGVRKK
jgi:hypothetical protein